MTDLLSFLPAGAWVPGQFLPLCQEPVGVTKDGASFNAAHDDMVQQAGDSESGGSKHGGTIAEGDS
jgi:hypothetical protein